MKISIFLFISNHIKPYFISRLSILLNKKLIGINLIMKIKMLKNYLMV